VFYVRTRAGRVVRHRTELDHHAATVRSPQQVRQIISGYDATIGNIRPEAGL